MKAEESNHQTQECITTLCPANWLWGLSHCRGVSSRYVETHSTNNSPTTQRNVISSYKCFVTPCDTELLCVRVLY